MKACFCLFLVHWLTLLNTARPALEPGAETTLRYTLIRANSPDCLPSPPAESYPVLVQYMPCRSVGDTTGTDNVWRELESIPDGDCRTENLTSNIIKNITVSACTYILPVRLNKRCGQLRLVQLDHRGGYCDCWAIAFERPSSVSCARGGISVSEFLQWFHVDNHNFGNVQMFHAFCNGSASAPRGTIFNGSLCKSDTPLVNNKSDATHDGDCCNDFLFPHLKVTFSILFENDAQEEKHKLNSFEEGVELAYRIHNTSSITDWIPIGFYTSERRPNKHLSVGKYDNVTESIRIRGYSVPYNISYTHNVQLKMCDGLIANSDWSNSCLQFRWLQTVRQKNEDHVDVATLDDVRISLRSSLQHDITLLEDSFTGGINNTTWITRHVVSGSYCVKSEKDCGNGAVQFGRYIPSFTPLGSQKGFTRSIISRELSTVCLSPKLTLPQLSYTLITANSPDCRPPSAPVHLQYRVDNDDWMTIYPRNESTHGYTTSQMAHIQMTTFIIDLYPSLVNGLANTEFRFVQPVHRGGYCDCWSVANVKVTHNDLMRAGGCGIHSHVTLVNNQEILQNEIQTSYSRICEKSGQPKKLNDFKSDSDQMMPSCGELPSLDSANPIAEFCQDSASVPREFELSGKCHTGPVVNDTLDIICTETGLSIEVNFDLQLLPSGGCDSVDTFNEGVELSVRESATTQWVPLMYITSKFYGDESSGLDPITITDRVDSNSLLLRGYSVPYVVSSGGHYNVSFCASFQHPLEFRWLQTSAEADKGVSDVILLDNISITVHNSTHSGTLFSNDFDHQNSINRFSEHSSLYNVHQLSDSQIGDCRPSHDGGALIFYAPPTTSFNSTYQISSRQVVIGPLNLLDVEFETTFSRAEAAILKDIKKDESLNEIFNLISEDPGRALNKLDNLLSAPVSGEDNGSPTTASGVDITAATFLLSSINNQLKEAVTVDSNVSKTFLSVADSILNASNVIRGKNSTENDLAGSTLLQALDKFSLNTLNGSSGESHENFVVFVHEKFVKKPIEEENAEIELPNEIVKGGVQGLKMASFFFKNMSGQLPDSVNNTDSNSNDTDIKLVSRLASPVISTSFQCDNCTTSNLSTTVNVTFKLSPYDEALLKNDPNALVKCVFWKFEDTGRTDAVLYPGQWSEDGCETVFDPARNRTICRCNHLTHFAILLSARPLNLSPGHSFALEIIGYVGVSVSLVAMAVTVLVFLYLNYSIKRPMYKMRNYIHIQLCVTLSIAQIIFVAGIKPNMGEGTTVGGVPVGCRLVAVLLHYWFLVSFMWMLMEGVVLYVALVRVFDKRHKMYTALFTIASYGLPLLYVGVLTVPLGFARNEEMRYNQTYDYGYKEVCYLNPETSFIWSLIAPVILIFLANVGFFIMAIVIMCKHQRSSDSKKRAKKVKHWLKACVSLAVVMGITWIIGVLVIEVEELSFLATIFTICVAFQGVFIFIIFVILSEWKRLKENLTKRWKKRSGAEYTSKRYGESSSITTATTLSIRRPVKPQDIDTYVEDGPTHVENNGTFFDVIYIPPTTKMEDFFTPVDGEDSLILDDMLILSSSDEAKDQSPLTTSFCSSEEKLLEETSLHGDNKEQGALTSVDTTADSANGVEEKELETKSEPNLYSDFTSGDSEAAHAQQKEHSSKL